jgi:hypothetical protein
LVPHQCCTKKKNQLSSNKTPMSTNMKGEGEGRGREERGYTYMHTKQIFFKITFIHILSHLLKNLLSIIIKSEYVILCGVWL